MNIVLTIAGLILAAIGIYYARQQVVLILEDRKKQREANQQILSEEKSQTQAPQIPQTSTPIIDLSEIYVPSSFHGREKEIDDLTKLVESGQRVITLLGMGGIGKSVLACKVAERVKDKFDAVWGFSFKTDVTLQGFLVRIGKKLLGDGAQQMAQDELKAQVLNALQSGRRLLVLDNYETVLQAQEQSNTEANALHDFLNRLGANTTLLITSREAPTHLTGEKEYKIPALERDPAVAVIQDELSIKKELYTHEVLSDIAEKLSDHPLACSLIGGYLAESPLKPEEAVEQVRALLLKAKAKTGEKNLISFEDSLGLSLKVLTPEERKLIEAVSVFQGPFTAEAAAFIGGMYEEKETDEEAEYDIHTDLAIDILDRLCRRSLMQCRQIPRYPQVEIYSIHALIRETIQSGLDEIIKDNALLKLGQYADTKSDYIAEKQGIVPTDWLVSVQEMHPDLVRGARRLGKDGTIALGNLAILLHNQGQYLDAIRMYEECRKIFEDAGDQRNVAVALHQIGMIHLQQGDYPAAQKKYEQAQGIFGELGAKLEQAAILHPIGVIHQYQGDYPAALEKYQQSLKIKQEIGDKAGEALTLGQMGNLFLDKGEYENALKNYNDVLHLFNQLHDNARVAITLHQIGIIHQDQGDYPAALEKYQQGLKIREAIADKLGIAQSLHQIGNIHYLQGDYPAALEKYQQSLKIREEIGDSRGIGQSLGQIGSVYEKQGDIPKAIELTKQALEIFERIGAKPEIEIVRGNLDRIINDK